MCKWVAIFINQESAPNWHNSRYNFYLYPRCYLMRLLIAELQFKADDDKVCLAFLQRTLIVDLIMFGWCIFAYECAAP